MKNAIENFFVITLFISIAFGSIVVIGQALGLILQNGNMMLSFRDMFSKLAFIFGSIAGLTSYVLVKLKKIQ